ncbi:helix-turn-helix transcriptional regulator [Timonella senegalensis]|uniref:helix-turn-helix transcriptional regulator n=1 Tax=Timonella senegalensis TaxID=1465825 RepID=UPI002FE08F7B
MSLYRSIVHSSPVPRTEWVIPQRADTVAHIVQALERSGLVLVTGPWGSGKTGYISAAFAELAAQNSQRVIVPVKPSSQIHEVEAILAADSAGAPPVVWLEKPHRLSREMLLVVADAVRKEQIALLVETHLARSMPQELVTLAVEVRPRSISIAPLRPYLGGPMVGEHSYILWYMTAGLPGLLQELVPSLLAEGVLRRGKYAWYSIEEFATSKELDALGQHQFHQLSPVQQSFLEYLSIAGSLQRSLVAPYLPDSEVEELAACGMIVEHVLPHGAVALRMASVLVARAIDELIPPGRRQTIFESLPQPTAAQQDFIGILAWSQAAVSVGHELTVQDISLACEAGFMRHDWKAVEKLVDLVVPVDASRAQIVDVLAAKSLEERKVYVLLLCQRGLSFIFQSRHSRALEEVALAWELIALDPDNLYSVRVHPITIELWVHKAFGHMDKARALVEREGAIAREHNDPISVEAYEIQAMVLYDLEREQGPSIEEMLRVIDAQHSKSGFGLTLVPHALFTLASEGRFDEAIALADAALDRRDLRVSAATQHSFPFAYAEVVSARFYILMLCGKSAEAFTIGDLQLAIDLIDSGVMQSGIGVGYAGMGMWEVATTQFRGALERFERVDPSGKSKPTLASYVQALAVQGLNAEAAEAIKDYDAAPYNGTANLRSEPDFRVLTARFALAAPDFDARLHAYIERAAEANEWFALLRGCHLAIVAYPSRGLQYLERLKFAAKHVDDFVSDVYLRDAAAILSKNQAELTASRALLTSLGAWIPAARTSLALTKRQREIAELVTRGLTNREIAERLTLSVRTVDAHVSSILMRTGASDRRELASFLSALL